MSEKWKSVFRWTIFTFVLIFSLELLSDYWMLGDVAFDQLIHPKYYTGRMFLAIILNLPFSWIFMKAKNKKVDEE